MDSQKRCFDPKEISLKNLVPPILLENMLRITVGVVNIAFLSRISDRVVSAVGISNQYIMMCQIIATAIATGSIVCINQAVGMGNLQRTEKLATIAFFANLVQGVLFSGLFLAFSGQLLTIMKLDEEAGGIARLYLQIVGGAMVIQCCEMVMSNISRSVGRVRAPLWVNIASNAVNLLLCYLVIFQPQFMPLHGVVGVACANVVSRFVGLLLSARILAGTGIRISLKHLHPFPWKDFKLSLSIGLPAGINNIAYSASQLITTSFISMTGILMISAKVYISNLVSYVALVGQACAQANSILIGYHVGAADYEGADLLRKRVTKIALLTNIAFSLLLMLFRKPLLQLFTSEPEILRIASTILLIDIFVEIGRALNNSISGALQATGDVNFQLVVNQSCGWLVSVGMSYVFGILCGWGLYGIWVAFACDELIRGGVLLCRWRSKKWVDIAKKNRRGLSTQSATDEA